MKKAVGNRRFTAKRRTTSVKSKDAAKENVPVATSTPEAQPVSLSITDVFNAIIEGYGTDGDQPKKEKAKQYIQAFLQKEINAHEIASLYNVVLLYDNTRIVDRDADRIYSAVSHFAREKPVLLLLHSHGGYISVAYLVGKLLCDFNKQPFHIVVPRRAKSAATLICCAADFVHMGSLSELGPIDPQIEDLPALGLKSAIQHIAELVKEHPHATELFSQYLTNSVKPIHLGYYERVAESAAQYAERLLKRHDRQLLQPAAEIAKSLVYSYKDHGFVIDVQEAQSIFGTETVKHNSPEYKFGNEIYHHLVLISQIADLVDQRFCMIGNEPLFISRKAK